MRMVARQPVKDTPLQKLESKMLQMDRFIKRNHHISELNLPYVYSMQSCSGHSIFVCERIGLGLTVDRIIHRDILKGIYVVGQNACVRKNLLLSHPLF